MNNASIFSGIGENITFFPIWIDGEKVVEHWYSENMKYEYDTPGWQAGTNYFTQVVWKTTEEVHLFFFFHIYLTEQYSVFMNFDLLPNL